MKFLDILRTANANLGKSKLRTFLTISAVFIGSLTLMLTTGVGAGLKTYVNDQVNAVGAKDTLLIQGQVDSQGPTSDGPKEFNPDAAPATSTGFQSVILLGPSDIAKIKATKGITSVQPMYTTSAEYITSGAKKYQVATSEAVDKAKEIMDYDTSKPLFEEWSAGIAKASGGKSLVSSSASIAAGSIVDGSSVPSRAFSARRRAAAAISAWAP